MSRIVKRTIAVLAALLLAGASVGCDREAGDDGVTMGEPGVEQEQEETALSEQEGMDEPEGAGEAPQPGQQGGQQAGEQQQAVEQVRNEVSDELGIPASAVNIDDQARQNITQATSEVQRRGWGMVSTIDNQMQQLNMDNLDEEETQAANELRQQVSQAQQSLQQMGQAGEEQASELESQLEDQLNEMSDNWEQISDKMQFEEQPAGGGPLDDVPGTDNMPGMDNEPGTGNQQDMN